MSCKNEVFVLNSQIDFVGSKKMPLVWNRIKYKK